MKNPAIKQLLTSILLAFVCLPALADTTFVKFGASWKYLDIGSAAPTGAGAADWRNIAFNDASWSTGLAEFGYGDNKERTLVNFGGNPASKYVTTYFRTTLNIADLTIFSGIRLNTYLDDGAVIYVNGTEVARSNMPAGSPAYATLASGTAAENGNAIIAFNIATSAFVTGDNIIAVEVHQNAVNSSDLTFDLEMIGKTGSIFGFGSTWKYLDDGSNQATAWRAAAFADGSWKTGSGKFGYGDPVTTIVYSGCPPSNYPAAEVLNPSCGTKSITTYFRKTFNITGAAAYTSFTLNIYRDDGIAVYVNGVERVRDNLIAGAAYNTGAIGAAGDDGQTVNVFNLPAGTFTEGSNTIAVELHQNAGGSTDLTFDMELIGNPSAGIEPDVTRGPMLQMVNGTSVTIRWTTTAAVSSRVKWGAGENALTNTMSDGTAVTDHEMRITGLTPDTKYFYAIGSVNSIVKGSYRNYFITTPPASTTRKIRIGVFGDAGRGDANQKASRNAYLNLKSGYDKSELAILLGDNAYDNGTETEHTNNMFNIYNNNLFDNHVVFPVPGNHEYANNGTRAVDHAIPYYNIFTVPDNAQSGGLVSGTEHYYSFDYGNIHFIMLDSYGIDGGKHLYDDTTAATGSQQALWLKADLAAHAGTRKWTIVCLHHPPYTNGTHRSDNTGGEGDLLAIRQRIVPILERYGVDLVLAGHSHVYERSFLVKDHTGTLSTPFNTAAAGAGTKISSSNARYDGSVASNVASADTSAANSTCPYFTIDSVYKHGTVYVVAGSAGQIGSGTGNTYPVFYTRNQSASSGGESGSLMLEIQDNRLDAKFVGNSGTVRDQFTIMKGVNRKQDVDAITNTPVNLTASWIGGYNWFTVPATITGTSRTLATTAPSTPGDYVYYVSDSLAPKVTCIADTFTLRVTSPLAVSVINYDAFLKTSKVLVQWTTTQELNSDYFIIERSANGRDYEMLMVMDGKGNSATPTNYEFTDNSPLEGTGYYRLTAVDLNGDKKIVGVRTVTYRLNKTFAIAIKPNPAINNTINSVIQSTRKQTLKVKLFDMRGAEAYSANLQVNAGNNPLMINMRPGSYVISIEAPDGSVLNEKVIVK
jgi:acid phosphatase type 7